MTGHPSARMPPHDLEAETAVLSACLLDPGALVAARQSVRPEHFYALAHRRILEACIALADQDAPVDAVTVAGWLRSRERLAEVGGVAYIARVVDAVPSVANVETYARTVRERAVARQMIATCQRIAAEGYGDVGEVRAWLDRCAAEVSGLTASQTSTTAVSIGEVIKNAFAKIQLAAERAKNGQLVTGMTTGFYDLNELTSGMHEGELWIVAGRPGMGKTAFANMLCIAPSAYATRDEDVRATLFASLEMPLDQIGTRFVVSNAEPSGNGGNLDLGAIRKGIVPDWNGLTRSAASLSGLPIDMLDGVESLYDLQAQALRAKAKFAAAGTPLGVVLVDYLQLVPANEARGKSREQEVAEISKGLKRMAKKLGVCVVALAQPSRKCEERADKRPMLSDLRESGAIEQDADAVCFLYRDEYYNENSPDKGRAEVIVAKQRNGPTGRVLLGFDAARTRFYNLEVNQ